MSNANAQQMPNNQSSRYDRLLREMQAEIDQLKAARNLDLATITALAGMGIRTSDFNGTDFAHPGSQGNYFGGDGLVANNIYLRPGSVGNDKLTTPVVPGVINSIATNFAVSHTAWTNTVSFNATVPAGCTQLLALATGMVYAVNPNTTGGSNGTGGDVLECRIGIGGTFGMAAGVSISGSNGQTSCPAAYAQLLTGLTPGGTVTLVTQSLTGFQAFAANSNNQANLCATLTWLR